AQQRTAEHGLARPHIADQRHQPLLARDAVDQRREDVVMTPRAQQEARVRREGEGRLLEAEKRLVHQRHLLSGDAGPVTTDGVKITISSSPVELISRLLKSQPSTGMRPNTGTSRLVVELVSLVTPPITSRCPSPITTSASWRRLKMEGLPCTVWVKSGASLSKTTFMRIFCSPSSLMSRGVTSSFSSASLNCTWETPWVGVLVNGTSTPREITALAFSTVTAFGAASVRALPWTSSAWIARLMLKLLPIRPSKSAPAGVAPSTV